MDRRAAWVLGILFGGLFLCLFGFLFLFYTVVSSDSLHSSSKGSGPRVGVVEITGTIMDAKKTLKELRQFEKDDAVKALVLRVDTPGGAVGPSQEIYDAVNRIKASKKVVVSMGSVAASGGFYIASAGDKVFSNPGTLTGSIGVIFETPNVAGLLKWAGVSMNVIKAGKMKDIGSAFRDMQPEERSYLESMLEDVHQQFIEAVAKGRHLKVEEVKPIADGRVFTGRQAKELKLVDELGGFDAAVVEAGKLAGISGEPKLEYPKKDRRLFRELMGDDDMDSMFQGAAAKLTDAVSARLEYRMSLPEGR